MTRCGFCGRRPGLRAWLRRVRAEWRWLTEVEQGDPAAADHGPELPAPAPRRSDHEH